jgi:hypothetical protein
MNPTKHSPAVFKPKKMLALQAPSLATLNKITSILPCQRMITTTIARRATRRVEAC